MRLSRGRPMIVENTTFGQSSPANPALSRPEPLSRTMALPDKVIGGGNDEAWKKYGRRESSVYLAAV